MSPSAVRVSFTTRRGTFKDERALHRRHARDRLVGEWFSPTFDVLNEATEGRAMIYKMVPLDVPEGKLYRSAGPPAVSQRSDVD